MTTTGRRDDVGSAHGARVAPLSAADLADALAVTESAGWLHTADDWRAVLRAGRVFGHRRESGELVSTTALFEYGTTLVAIGMVVVMPAWRGRGLAGALMTHALAARRQPAAATMLIATPHGFPLYQRLGFSTIAHVRRMARPASGASGIHDAGPEVTPMREADQPEVRALDAAALGADRARMLEARRAYACAAAVVRGGDGRVTGFALGTLQRGTLVVGPVVAADAESAAALVRHVAAGHDGLVRVDIPVDQTALAARLGAAGFERGDDAPLMTYGGVALPGDRRRLFAIATRGFC